MAFSLPDIRPLRLVCVLVLVAIAAWHLRMSLLLQSEFSDRKVADPEIAYERNPRMLTWHGKERHLIEADTAGAERLFRQALAVNPVFIPAWLGLAELKNDTGDRKAADALLDLVDRTTEGVNRYRWDKVLVAHQMGRRDILERDLVWLAAEATGKTRDDALRLAFSLWPEPAELMRVMGADNLASLFSYAVRSRRVDEAAILWAGLGEAAATLDRAQVADFVELLLREDKVEQAGAVWRQVFGPEPLLHDGSFADKPLQKAFGWRMGKVQGSSWRVAKGEGDEPARALRVQFNNLENIDYRHLSQIEPLTGGRGYRLKGQWKSLSLTTDQRPFVEVIGHKCEAEPARTEMIEPSQPWREFRLDFTVPAECHAMMVRVRRTASLQIDNQLGGELWLAELGLTPTTIAIAPLKEVTP